MSVCIHLHFHSNVNTKHKNQNYNVFTIQYTGIQTLLIRHIVLDAQSVSKCVFVSFSLQLAN